MRSLQGKFEFKCLFESNLNICYSEWKTNNSEPLSKIDILETSSSCPSVVKLWDFSKEPSLFLPSSHLFSISATLIVILSRVAKCESTNQTELCWQQHSEGMHFKKKYYERIYHNRGYLKGYRHHRTHYGKLLLYWDYTCMSTLIKYNIVIELLFVHDHGYESSVA